MKPDWDKLMDEYAGSSSVVIGDVDCTSDGGKDVCNEAGVKGYPTIKYFTAETGEEGEAYQGARSFDALKSFVDDSLDKGCVIDSPDTCDEKESAYVEKMKAKDGDAIKKELTRLSDMLATAKMAADKKAWMAKRLSILKQM
jgi:protein disulfide-isomerase A6